MAERRSLMLSEERIREIAETLLEYRHAHEGFSDTFIPASGEIAKATGIPVEELKEFHEITNENLSELRKKN